MRLRLLAIAVLFLGTGSGWAQAPFQYVISNVADIPQGSTHNIRISFSYVSGTNWLSAEGLNALDFGLRMVNPVNGSVSTVNAVPTIGTTIPPNDIAYNTGFSSAQAAYGPSNGLFESVTGFTNVVGFSLVAPGATGVGIGSSTVFIADIRLRGDVMGPVTLQAFVLRPSLLSAPEFPDGQTFTSTFKDLGLSPGQGGFGPLDAGFATFNVIASVPEPGTWAFIILSGASGLAGLNWYRKRRLAQANQQFAMLEEGVID
jgi:hypothetical protein